MSQGIRIAGLLVIAVCVALPATAGARSGGATIDAEVTGAGAKRELTWWVLRRANQNVTFVERGGTKPRVLGISKGGTGSVRFKPSNGRSRLRRIVARVELNGVLSEELTVARFTVRVKRH
jgi:hypothetical protein